ncbi:hypothetical protein ACET3Z_032346 [Daucus carota]
MIGFAMESSAQGLLDASEIHGFRTLQELDISNIMEEAKGRWLRPNEVHAILCNHKYFNVFVKPVNFPSGGTIVLFDRRKLRNFRKDGHSWKKKKDGKTVKEAHEHLKVGNEERIHVYYAHGQDNTTFVRRCYWLLDKKLENIVLVHYRETQEMQSQGSPIASINSNSCSALSEQPAWLLPEESDSGVVRAYSASTQAPIGNSTEAPNKFIQHHEIRLHEINTLEWDELVVPDDPNKLTISDEGNILCFEQRSSEFETNGHKSYINDSNNSLFESNGRVDLPLINGSKAVNTGTDDSLRIINKDGLQTQDSIGRWMTYIMADSTNPEVADDPNLESFISTGQDLSTFMNQTKPSMLTDHQNLTCPEQMFTITDISPASALSAEETKILVVGYFHQDPSPLAKSNLLCVCGDECISADLVQAGVYRSFVSPHKPGLVDLYLSFDGQNPISQVVTFEYHCVTEKLMNLSENKLKEEFQYQMRLSHLLFSASNRLTILSSKPGRNALKEAKIFIHKTCQISDNWTSLVKSINSSNFSYLRAKDSLFEITLQNRLHEWLLDRIVEGSEISVRDDQGLGVIHYCAILGYTWAVYPFSLSGLSLDYRDKYGWTALHWASSYGRKDMVAALLSAGAKPNLVTDPTSENPGGCTGADLASKNGYDGLAAYLAEKGLVEHFKDMSIAGNVSGSLQITTSNFDISGTFTEEETFLKDTLAAYRTAADAAARIQAAFREQSLKLQRDAIQLSNPEDEARNIIAAMKIQHAFRNHETRKKILAAARIQHRFHTWKIRKDFLNLRRQTVRIQAIFRGFQVRKQYRKIIFAVGVLEKVILRWRLKRKGFRGLQVCPGEVAIDVEQNNNAEEDFFKVSRKQAEERVERSVVRVQAMFRSKRAQEDYQKMKLAHHKASLEYEGLVNPDTDMG